jgi:DNA invertase Pin-like site-specific DNA recombinase
VPQLLQGCANQVDEYLEAEDGGAVEGSEGGQMNVGYGRVSTLDQNPGLQVSALKDAGCEHVFIDTVSGAKHRKERPQLNACMRFLNAGDVLIVWKLDRFSRSLPQMVMLIDELCGRKIGFKSLTESFIDTTSPQGLLVMQIFGSVAQYERSLILERTKAGIDEARRRGVIFGPPKTVCERKVMMAIGMYKDGISVPKILSHTGLARPTFYRYLNLHKEPRRDGRHRGYDSGDSVVSGAVA